MVLEKLFSNKYSPSTLLTLPLDNELIQLFNNFIRINRIQLLLISDDDYLKSIIVKTFISTLSIDRYDTLFVSKIKDQGVTNMRYELKMFCGSPSKFGKKLLVIDDIHIFSETIQKLFVNNIDKWNKNIHILVTCNNIYNVDEILTIRLFPINIPCVSFEKIKIIVETICCNESITLDSSNKNLISRLSRHNIQNAYHVLEKCKLLQSSIQITPDIIKQCCTLIKFDILEEYFTLCKKKHLKPAYRYLLKIIDNGHSVLDILNEIYNYNKNSNILDEKQKYRICKIISDYIIVFITIHEEELELLLFTKEVIDIF